MKNNPHPTAFASCSDRALAEKATAFYYAISNNTELANTLPGFETFNAARLAFMEALEKANFPTRRDIAAKNARRRKLAFGMAALKEYITPAPDRGVIKPEKPALYNHCESQLQPVRTKNGKGATEKPGQFLLAILFRKMIQGMRSYWPVKAGSPHF